MSKYVIDLRPDCKVVQQICESDGQLSIHSKWVNYLKELNSDYINEHFGDLQDTAYKKGLHDGESKCGYCNEYQRGLDDAWECARELYLNGACKDLFGEYFNTFIKNHTAQEAVEKLKAYEEKQKADDEIKVGDEVETKDGKRFVVTTFGSGIDCDIAVGVCADGLGLGVDLKELRKTGRHFDIASILEDMRND